MGQATVGRRGKINKTRLFINGGLLFLGCLFLFLLWFLISVREDKPLFATSIMALAIVATAGISLVSIRQNLHMLTLNQRMIDEMRRSRPKPGVKANIVKSSRRVGYDLIVENIGRELARNIKVLYCLSRMPEPKPGEKPKAIGENDLVDSDWIVLNVMPLGPQDKQEFSFDGITDPKIWFVKFRITYSDGVESYEEEPYRIDAHDVRLG